MDSVQEIRSEISDYWHTHLLLKPVGGANRCFATEEQYDAFCVSKDWIQDTSEAIWAHRRKGFSKDPLEAYLELWGIMQASFVLQDAIAEMFWSVYGDKMQSPKRPCAWHEIRDHRNLTVGHPNNRDRPPPGENRARCVIGRSAKTYENIEFQVHHDGHVTTKQLDLGELLDRFDADAKKLMLIILQGLKKL